MYIHTITVLADTRDSRLAYIYLQLGIERIQGSDMTFEPGVITMDISMVLSGMSHFPNTQKEECAYLVHSYIAILLCITACGLVTSGECGLLSSSVA